MKIADIRKLTPDERLDKLLQLRKSLMETRFKRVAGPVEKTHEIREMRRTIARLKTVLRAARTPPAAADKSPN